MTDVQTETETNGKTKEPSLVSVIRQEWVAAGGKPAAKTAIKPVLDAWRASEKAQAVAVAAADKAKQDGYQAAMQLAKMVGCTPLQFDGQLHEFSSREGKVFLRVKGERSTAIEL